MPTPLLELESGRKAQESGGGGGAGREAEKHSELRLAFERLSVEKECLADQLQVSSAQNAELKRLVVASMGDDLGTQLDAMTHNKAHLAQSIVNYTNQLSQGQESIEKLAIQCDIWRTKYLATRFTQFLHRTPTQRPTTIAV